MIFTFSRILRVAYPVAIVLTAVILAWTNSVQGVATTQFCHEYYQGSLT